jgi:hypothetical protein
VLFLFLFLAAAAAVASSFFLARHNCCFVLEAAKGQGINQNEWHGRTVCGKEKCRKSKCARSRIELRTSLSGGTFSGTLLLSFFLFSRHSPFSRRE